MATGASRPEANLLSSSGSEGTAGVANRMTEEELTARIDYRFPYGAPRDWRRSIALARNISANAGFMFIHELCRPQGHLVYRQQPGRGSTGAYNNVLNILY